MLTQNFYDIIDHELEKLLVKYQDDEYIKKQSKSLENQKSYGFLIWFLEFYGKKTSYLPYITDGNDDSSCDIIFDNIDIQNKRIFYVVQSKWTTKKKCCQQIDSKDIKLSLDDFGTILRGHRSETKNKNFNKKLLELQQHIENNGEVKFIFLTLCKNNETVADNIKRFLEEYKRTSLEIIDIERIKRDYIEFQYKKIKPNNPLEYKYSPEESIIEIEIERLDKNDGNYIKIDKPFESYIFLIKPRIIYQLFDQYGYSLFFNNIRNPLINSTVNQQIQKTIAENPDYFWYYNNGITAITYLSDDIRKEAKKIQLTGLQIINGAQTVYAIYEAYKNASEIQRKVMDQKSLITLRLLQSGGRDFDLQVTRYTNSQNPVSDRDFHANDEIQQKLQNESFETGIWYERREGEFRQKPDNILILSNIIFADTYLAYYLQEPVTVIKNHEYFKETNKYLIFLSHRENIDGLYEKVFNQNTKFKDMLCSFYLLDLILYLTESSVEQAYQSDLFHILALFKIVFTKYSAKKYGTNIPTTNKIIELFTTNQISDLGNIIIFIRQKIEEYFENIDDEQEKAKNMYKYITSLSYYERLQEMFESMELNLEEIDSLKSEEKVNQSE